MVKKKRKRAIFGERREIRNKVKIKNMRMRIPKGNPSKDNNVQVSIPKNTIPIPSHSILFLLCASTFACFFSRYIKFTTFIKNPFYRSFMEVIDEKGRFFGLINILDLAILMFIIIFVASLFLYSKYPPQLKEHRDVLFQMYFPYIPDAIGQQVFVPGTPLVATYAKDDTAVIVDVKEFILYIQDPTISSNTTGFLITINGSLEVDAEGDLLFNGNDVAAGNYHDVQVGSSYLNGKIWRVDYDHSVQQIEIKIKLTNVPENSTNITQRDIVFDTVGHPIGKVMNAGENNEQYLTISLQADLYDGDFFVSEMPVQQFAPLYFVVNDTFYRGIITEVSS